MKNRINYSFIILLGVCMASVSFTIPDASPPENNTTGKIFKLFYIDNSKPGLSTEMVDFIYEKVDSIKDNPCLLYMSNSDKPKFAKNATQVKEKLSVLTEQYSHFPDCIFDKKKI